MKKFFISIVISSVFLSGTNFAYACDFCLLSQGISPLDTVKGTGIKISERYTLLDKVYQGTSEQTNPGAKETHWTTELTGFYGLTPDFTLMAVVPYKKGRTTGDPDFSMGTPMIMTNMAGEASGLGDIAVMARYSFLKNQTTDATTIFAAVAGVKFPTGSTNAKTADGTGFLDSHLQPGTGSTDYVAGLSYIHSLDRFSLSANLLATIPGEGKFGDTKHKFGNALNYDVTGKYRIVPGVFAPMKTQWFAALGINGEARNRETEDGVTDPDSGGNTVYLTPGFQVVVAPHWIVDVTYQYAVYHNLYGTQLGETCKVVSGVTYLF